MDKTLISWSVPNMITIWLMLAIGFLIFTFAAQFGMKALGGSSGGSDQAQGGGY
jgi:hypothetical protein